MTETDANFPDPDIPTISYLGIEQPKIDSEITYLDKNNIDESIQKNLSKKDVYESDTHKIYNLILVQTHEKLQEKAALDATFKAVKDDQEPIGYMMILKRLCFLIQSEQHPIRSFFLDIRRLYNTMSYVNKNTTK